MRLPKKKRRKTMTAIIKKELVSAFKTSYGWFCLGVYTLLSAVFFSIFVLWQNTGYVGNYFGFWLFFIDLVFVTVLSMKLLGDEKKNGTDQLILTSPVSVHGYVLGKFFGAYIIYALAFLVNFVYFGIIVVFGTPDYGVFFSNCLGNLLIGAAIVAIAIFVSSVTSTPAGAAAGTFSVLFGMMVVEFFTSFCPMWVQYIFRYTVIYNYYADFSNGIVSLPAVIYYLSVTAVFIFLAVRMTEKRRWN